MNVSIFFSVDMSYVSCYEFWIRLDKALMYFLFKKTWFVFPELDNTNVITLQLNPLLRGIVALAHWIKLIFIQY